MPSAPCASCQTQNIREWVLPSSPSDRGLWRDSLDWLAIVKNNNCGLCNLIVKTLFQDPSFVEAVRGGVAAEVDIASRNTGKVIWKSVEEDSTESSIANIDLRSGWYVEKRSIVRHIRRIDVSVELNERYWQGVIRASVHDAIDEKNRLLLVRSMPYEQIDIRRMKYCLCDCEAYHGSACRRTIWNDLHTFGVRMIDVKARCVVSAPAGYQYLALSYFWGDPTKVKHLQLTNAKFEQFRTPGALSGESEQIPHTIRDAIHLTQCIEYQYLWVDALCIIQDDKANKADKEVQLNLMDRLYKSAMITIAASAGDNAWSGLPGAFLDLAPVYYLQR